MSTVTSISNQYRQWNKNINQAGKRVALELAYLDMFW